MRMQDESAERPIDQSIREKAGIPAGKRVMNRVSLQLKTAQEFLPVIRK